jgi:hypothetical protein
MINQSLIRGEQFSTLYLHFHDFVKMENENGRLSIIDQHYALIITPLFDTQAPTCFSIHVPSSGSFLRPYELLEGRNSYVVCHVL